MHAFQVVNQRDATNSKIFKRKEFNLQSLGIGGLSAEFADIFRRVFTSRVFPSHVASKYGILIFVVWVLVWHFLCTMWLLLALLFQAWYKACKRYAAVWTPRNWQDPYRSSNRQDVEWDRTKGLDCSVMHFCWQSYSKWAICIFSNEICEDMNEIFGSSPGHINIEGPKCAIVFFLR